MGVSDGVDLNALATVARGVALFPASPLASHVTGQTIVVDGGLTS